MQDYTFSDGTFIPKGTKVAIPMHAIHHDEEIYPHANVFDPWRWSDVRQDETEVTKFQMVSTGPEHVPFGHGRHGWCAPLRFSPLCPFAPLPLIALWLTCVWCAAPDGSSSRASSRRSSRTWC